jgi:hypothetical protein
MESKPRVPWSVFSILIVLSFCFPAGGQVLPPLPNGVSSQRESAGAPGEISGHVYRADTGQPLFDADVVLYSGVPIAGRLPETRTAADGSFEFSAVAPGSYTIEAHANEFLSNAYGQDGPETRAKVISLGSGQRVEGVEIRLALAGSISGTVYDENGKPVHGIMVLAVQPRFVPGGGEQVWGGDGESTDIDGSFRINRLRPASYLVRAGGLAARMKDGFRYPETYYPGTDLLKNAQSVQVVAGRDTGSILISVRSGQTHKIAGTITDAEPSPQRRYEIAVTEFGGIQPGTCCSPSADTSEKSFSTGDLLPGEYLVTVTAISPEQRDDRWSISSRGYARVSVSDSDAHVNVVIGNGGQIRGKVSVEGQPGAISTPRVVLVRADGLQRGPSTATDPNGEFVIRDVPPGAYRFFVPAVPNSAYLKAAQCSGRDHTIDPLEINLGEVVTDCELTMQTDPGALRGQVLVGDQPATAMAVVLVPERPELRQLEGYAQTAKTGSSGQFQMSGVIPGNYLVFATPPLVGEAYYAPEFLDENRSNAQRLSILPHEQKVIDLRALATE